MTSESDASTHPARPREATALDAGQSVLEATGLIKAFAGHRVVDRVSIRVGPGEIVGLLGPNGAGKTTTFAMIVGLLDPDEGSIRLGELDLTGWPLHKRALRGLAYLPQEASIFRRLTVRENIELILEQMGHDEDTIHEEAARLVEEFGLFHVADNRGYTLSGGERRRAEIARAMAISPRYMLLDEPFAGIDPIAVADIQRIVRALAGRGIGVLVTDHNVRETLQITDRAYIISEGRIFRSGSPYDLAADAEVRAIYLGEEFRLE